MTSETKIKIPKDIQLKIGTKEEAAWTVIKKGAIEEIAAGKRLLIINEEILKLAEKQIKKEKDLNI